MFQYQAANAKMEELEQERIKAEDCILSAHKCLIDIVKCSWIVSLECDGGELEATTSRSPIRER